MDLIEQHRTTLVFCNTRSLAELIFQDLWAVNDKSLPIGIHHGSLALEARRRVENAMASGKLRALVATSSLDLGVDWGDIDLVVQMGAPKGSSRLLQRIGRANHRLDEPSKGMIVPGNRFEYLEAQAALDAVDARELDPEIFRPGTLVDNAATYLRELDGLLYGDDPAQGFVTGRRYAHPVMRIAFEAPALVRGLGRYAADAPITGQAQAYFVRSQHAFADIKSIDIDAAKAVPGVLAVLTAVASALLDNVTTVVLMTPVTFFIAQRLGANPVPFLISEILASNIGGRFSVLTPVGFVPAAFLGIDLDGSPEARDESLEVRLFRPEEIPWDELAFRSTREALREFVG